MTTVVPFTAQLNQLSQFFLGLTQQYHRLIIIVGKHGKGKTRLLKSFCRQKNIPYLNVNLRLGQRLLNLTTKQRPLRVLDNIELLFDPTLHQDPLALLKELSRNRSLIVAWAGTYDDKRQVLTYAEPGHPEYRHYERPDVTIMTR